MVLEREVPSQKRMRHKLSMPSGLNHVPNFDDILSPIGLKIPMNVNQFFVSFDCLSHFDQINFENAGKKRHRFEVIPL